MCLLFLISFPVNTLADEAITNEFTEEIITEDETTAREIDITHMNFWLVPLSSQIKVTFSEKSTKVLVEVYLSSDGENFEHIADTYDSYYLIDNLSHREKYFVKLVSRYGEYERHLETQEVRVK